MLVYSVVACQFAHLVLEGVVHVALIAQSVTLIAQSVVVGTQIGTCTELCMCDRSDRGRLLETRDAVDVALDRGGGWSRYKY